MADRRTVPVLKRASEITDADFERWPEVEVPGAVQGPRNGRDPALVRPESEPRVSSGSETPVPVDRRAYQDDSP